MSDDYVLEVILEFQNKKKDITLTEAYVQQSITVGLKNLFGEVGASYPIEIEKLTKTDFGALILLRCPAFCYIKVRSSITLLSSYHSQPCAYHVSRVGPSLLELFNNPRKIVF
jgi:hypothetical protein